MIMNTINKNLLVLFIILVTDICWSQNDYVTTHNELNQKVFSNIIQQCDTDFLLNLSNCQSTIFQLNNSNNQSNERNASDWILAYNDLVLSYLPDNNPYKSVTEYYKEIALKRHEINGDIIQLPIGVLFTDYNYVDVVNGLEQNLLSVGNDGYKLEINSNQEQIIEKKTLFAANIIADELSIYETVRVFISDLYNISKEPIQNIEIIKDGEILGSLSSDNYLDINLNAGINNFAIKYIDSLGKIHIDNFKLTGKGLDIQKSTNTFSIPNILNTNSESFYNTNIYGSTQKAEIKIFYGCNNFSNKIKKPAIMVMGYSPLNIENFVTLVTKYNTNGYLDELHLRNYDVIVVRFAYGADRIENQALLVKDIIKTINQRKFNNNSYIENNITGYSSGALVARMALKMMETEYAASPSLNKLHHSRLLISYDGEHEGANIPLAAQHSLISILENPQWYLPETGILQILENYFLISSPLAKDFLIYHYTQTGNSTSPNQGPHPFFTEARTKLVTDYYYQPAPYDKPGDYPIVRNIGISDGADNIYNHHLGTLANNTTVLEIDKHVGFLGWDRHNYMEWKLVDGDGHRVFKRMFRKKPIFSGSNYNVLLNEEKHVNDNSLKIDGIQGSFVGLYNGIRSATKATFLQSNPPIDIASTDCFLPTSSALDISTFGTLEYDLRANQLLYENEYTQDTQYGYPSIKFGASQYSKTPFDAIYAATANVKHGAGSEDDPETPLLTEFMLDEVHYDNIWLQFLRIGHWASGQYNYYPVKYEAVNTIVTGKNVTLKTQKKPFIVNPKSEVEMKAGNTITFEPGTEILSGSILLAHIGPIDICLGKKIFSGGEPENTSNENYEESKFQNDTIINMDIAIYPIPTKNILKIDFNNFSSGKYEIYSLEGRLIMSNHFKESLEININLTDITNGIYIIKINTNDQMISKKIIKE